MTCPVPKSDNFLHSTFLQTDFLNSVISDLQNKLEGVEAMKGLHGHMESMSSAE